jgi:hypothetical protein
MKDEYRRIYQEGNLDYASPLNFMLKVYKNSVPTANKIHVVYTATTNLLSSCVSIIFIPKIIRKSIKFVGEIRYF